MVQKKQSPRLYREPSITQHLWGSGYQQATGRNKFKFLTSFGSYIIGMVQKRQSLRHRKDLSVSQRSGGQATGWGRQKRKNHRLYREVQWLQDLKRYTNTLSFVCYCVCLSLLKSFSITRGITGCPWRLNGPRHKKVYL